jgi:lysophospholipase L1-like esterase
VKPPDPDEPPSWHLGEPFWRSSRIFGESLFFVREAPRSPPAARLLFPPAGPLQLTSASREIQYASPADYLVEADTGIVTLPAGSGIPFMDRAALFPEIGQEHSMAHKRGEERIGLYFGEGHLFHDRQAEASYDHHSSWNGFVPKSQLHRLPGTASKLKAPGPLKICIIGDSISTGWNASALSGVPPGMPPYPELWAGTIRRHRTGEVIFKNFAVSGTGMKYGAAVAAKVMDETPDLVLIAYGMNDAGFITVEEYVSHTTRLLGLIKARNQETEIILMASILGNPEWAYAPPEKYLLFRDALESFCGPGVALADMTSLWDGLLKIKSYLDLTGNGVNHPNDFGHRIIAQVLLDLLGFASTGKSD